jgi:murein DD-endopeptidase MepM/ murein hydrolase activator NlpD
MIRLKQLLFEQSTINLKSEDKSDKLIYNQADTPFSLSDTDPWEYYQDAKNKTWYTRRKGNTAWIDMEANLSAENWNTALERLTTYIKKKTNKDPEEKKDVDTKSKKSVYFDSTAVSKGERIILYWYKNKSWTKAGTYKVPKEPESVKIKYIATSSDKKYVLIQFIEESGKPKFWVVSKFITDTKISKKKAAPEPKPKPGINSDSDTENTSQSSKKGQHGNFFINSPFGPRVLNGERQNHKGLDIRAKSGTPIEIIKPGVVSRAGVGRGWGNVIDILHDDGTMSRYAHLKKIMVKNGDKVTPGTVIALSGGDRNDPGRGNSTAAHLHWEWMPDGKKTMDQADGYDVVADYFRFQ